MFVQPRPRAYGVVVTIEPSPPSGTVPSGSVPDLTKLQVEGMFEKKLAEAFAALGCFNLAVFGKTGVGKSTLVNAIFGRDVAVTGVGSPVTKGLVYYRHPDGFLGLYDSEGFETGTAGNAIVEGLRRIVADYRTGAVDRQIHAVWYLVRWSDRRFEAAQEQFVRELADLGLPVIVVMTQVPSRDGVAHPEALEFARYIESLGLPIRPHGRVVVTNALGDPFTGSPVFGLQTLLDDTYEVIPEVVAAHGGVDEQPHGGRVDPGLGDRLGARHGRRVGEGDVLGPPAALGDPGQGLEHPGTQTDPLVRLHELVVELRRGHDDRCVDRGNRQHGGVGEPIGGVAAHGRPLGPRERDTCDKPATTPPNGPHGSEPRPSGRR